MRQDLPRGSENCFTRRRYRRTVGAKRKKDYDLTSSFSGSVSGGIARSGGRPSQRLIHYMAFIAMPLRPDGDGRGKANFASCCYSDLSEVSFHQHWSGSLIRHSIAGITQLAHL